MRSYSDKGIAITESFEGLRLVAYQDSVGVWTIGYGHTKGVKAGDTCTAAQADRWLREDVAWAEDCVNRLVKTSITQNQFDALVDFTFNLGCKSLEGSELLRLVNAGRYADAACQFARWNHAGGKVVAGLTRRRAAEATLFVIGLIS
ncbi:lysozyme [Edaphobacter albus]|uniref:lysozyme n=1 Tax=Edaphobacter sp. 4G125 TaxID=2763071 RepID=UPI0016453066|nr:lysozyme [Edaphobacter sp. 4G125]QNI37522.1 lysozyme [Edaphobacter sp. 4G125]